MDENKEPEKKRMKDEDWDEKSWFRGFHKELTGITLSDDMILFYIGLFIFTVIVNIFTNN